MKTGVVLWYDQKLNHGVIKAFSGHIYAFTGNIPPGKRVLFHALNIGGDLIARNVKLD